MEIVGIIIVGAFAFRGVSSLLLSYTEGDFFDIPYSFSGKTGSSILTVYTLSAIPLALLNGFLLGGWVAMFVVGVCTWLGMLFINGFVRGNPIRQFLLFGTLNVLWTLYNLLQFF
jgi:hypothetical protein